MITVHTTSREQFNHLGAIQPEKMADLAETNRKHFEYGIRMGFLLHIPHRSTS